MAIDPDTKPNSLDALHFLVSAKFRFRRLTEAQLLAEFLAKACPNPPLATMGITEILMNAIEHGNLGIGFEEKSKLQSENRWLEEIDRRLELPEHINQTVELEFTKTNTHIQIKVTDQGKGFDWRQFEDKDPKKALCTHGRGITIAKDLVFQKLEYSEKGNEITCTIALEEPSKGVRS